MSGLRTSRRALARFLSTDLAIDLGTTNTLVYVRGLGVVLNEPSVVALNPTDGSVLAAGHEAKAMLGREPSGVQVIRPLRHGVIADFDSTEKMLRDFVARIHPARTLFRPRIVLSVPWSITQVEARAVRELGHQTGARETYLVQQPLAAAIGAGLPIEEPTASMVVDIGGGTTEVAVLSLADIVYCKSVRISGDEMNDTIIQYVRKSYSLLIGERLAEDVKIQLGSAAPLKRAAQPLEVRGRSLIDGLPKRVVITGAEVREALRDAVTAIVNAVHACLEATPPELAADLVDEGITLTGGGAQLTHLDVLLHQETGLPVRLSADPVTCVVRGAGKILDELGTLRTGAIPA